MATLKRCGGGHLGSGLPPSSYHRAFYSAGTLFGVRRNPLKKSILIKRMEERKKEKKTIQVLQPSKRYVLVEEQLRQEKKSLEGTFLSISIGVPVYGEHYG